MKPLSEVLGKLPLGNPPTSEVVQVDPLERARSVFRKGRHEAMGGPTFFTQDGMTDNARRCGYPPSARFQDPVAEELGVDSQE